MFKSGGGGGSRLKKRKKKVTLCIQYFFPRQKVLGKGSISSRRRRGWGCVYARGGVRRKAKKEEGERSRSRRTLKILRNGVWVGWKFKGSRGVESGGFFI